MTLYWFLNTIANAYVFTNILYFIFIYKKDKNNNAFLNISNLIILYVLIINILNVFYQTPFFSNLYKGSTIPIETNTKVFNTNFLNYIHLVIAFFSSFIFQLVFIYQKNRIKINYTILSVILVFINFNLGKIVAFGSRITKGDFISAIPTYFFNIQNLTEIAIGTIIYLSICYYLSRK